MLILGISGVATSGKDTLFDLLQKNIKSFSLKRFALADSLKSELDDFFIKNFSISAFTKNKVEKSMIRDFLVAYGKVKRIQSDGTYWTSIVSNQLKIISPNEIPVVTDIRYNEYKEDELFWLKNKNKGKLIHVARVNQDGSFVSPANKDEEKNDPSLNQNADYKLVWPTILDSNGIINDKLIKPYIDPLIDQINKWIKE